MWMIPVAAPHGDPTTVLSQVPCITFDVIPHCIISIILMEML
jgi:hypothetical protein